jgi:hypothetical protein
MFTTTHNLTGISATEFTLPDGRELPEFRIETEGQELYEWLREIDRTMNNTSWGRWGGSHQDWYAAWSDEFRRIRRAMGIFDPYSQTF